MAKAATVQARIDPKLKVKTDMILSKLGITASQAINALYAQIVMTNGLPFQIKIPNEASMNAIKEPEEGDEQVFSSFQAVIDDLDLRDPLIFD